MQYVEYIPRPTNLLATLGPRVRLVSLHSFAPFKSSGTFLAHLTATRTTNAYQDILCVFGHHQPIG